MTTHTPTTTKTTTCTAATGNNEAQGPRGHFQIHYFSTASTYTGKQTESLPAPLPLSRLFRELETRYPGIREKVLSSCGVSLGTEYVDVELEEENEGARNGDEVGLVIHPGDEVAIIPPVSSG